MLTEWPIVTWNYIRWSRKITNYFRVNIQFELVVSKKRVDGSRTLIPSFQVKNAVCEPAHGENYGTDRRKC